ncbi:MAG: D-alanyl-lipoteichoic acid acyltransferase DltB (MBOAT superfamily) [Bradymonadia bacterium]|jgi:D-alanyl-lipoteichoic acid acyltransferase DltB (MBOAT superfamily)
MRFDAFIFPIFFALVLVGYRQIKSVRLQNLAILAASYVFYGWWDERFLILILISTVVDYLLGLALCRADEKRAQGDAAAEPEPIRMFGPLDAVVLRLVDKLAGDGSDARRKRLVLVSAIVNLGILAVFKYFNFFIGSAVGLSEALGLAANPPMLHIILPVGISFYTFQTLGYSIDVYRRDQPAERDFVAFASYVTFFPQLVAGPIERASRLMPQFHVERTVDVNKWRSGITLIVFGLVKKVAIADNMSPMVDYVFGMEDPGAVPATLIFAGTFAFAIQIYADFSGYSDIARGTAKLLGFDLCVNFNKPYVAKTPSDFWRRWHISLSEWLRDYLYIPLGGNRGSEWFTYRNLALTMILGGLWHGAAWNFVVWGFWHGFILCVYRLLDIDKRLKGKGAAVQFAAVVLFSLLTLYGWMLFRAESWEQVQLFTIGVFGLTHASGVLASWSDWSIALPMVAVISYFSLPIIIHHMLSRGLRGEKWVSSNPHVWRASLAAVILYGIVHARADGSAFIYFQF